MKVLGFLDPQARRAITLDLAGTPWLVSGDTIATHSIAADGVTVSGDTHTDTAVSFFVEPTVASGSVSVTVHVTTALGEADDFTLGWAVVDT